MIQVVGQHIDGGLRFTPISTKGRQGVFKAVVEVFNLQTSELISRVHLPECYISESAAFEAAQQYVQEIAKTPKLFNILGEVEFLNN